MEQILQILSSKVTMVRSDNSVNRECLWLDLPMDHRKMLYNHCASGILEASKKDPALTDLRFLQLSAGHSQTNLSGVFCLSFKTICVLHAHSRRDASKLPSDYIANANSTPDVFWLTRSLGGKLPRRIYHVGLLLCRRWFSFNHHQLLQSGFFLCWSPCLGTSSMRALKIILRQPSCYV